MDLPTCPTCRQPRPTAIRDEVMTGANTKADQRLADAIAAAPTTKPTHRWYSNEYAVWCYGPNVARFCDKAGCELDAISESEMARKPVVPAVSYLRAREILGSAWPASWPQTDPDAPDKPKCPHCEDSGFVGGPLGGKRYGCGCTWQPESEAAPLPKAADADGWDYYADRCLKLIRRYRPGENRGEVADVGGRWIAAAVARDKHSSDHESLCLATRAECERFLGWPVTNPDNHDDGSQSRRTGAATAAILNRNGADARASAGTDADPSGDIAAQFAEVNRLLAQARAICEKGLAAHEAWKASR